MKNNIVTRNEQGIKNMLENSADIILIYQRLIDALLNAGLEIDEQGLIDLTKWREYSPDSINRLTEWAQKQIHSKQPALAVLSYKTVGLPETWANVVNLYKKIPSVYISQYTELLYGCVIEDGKLLMTDDYKQQVIDSCTQYGEEVHMEALEDAGKIAGAISAFKTKYGRNPLLTGLVITLSNTGEVVVNRPAVFESVKSVAHV